METFVAEKENEFANKLETIIKEFNNEITRCQTQADLWLQQKQLLQKKMNDALQPVQQVVAPTPPVPASPKVPTLPPKMSAKDATIPQLIRVFLEQHGPARPRDIRRFLLSQGRNTNPGVALRRLLDDGVLKNVEQGVYKLS